MDTYNCPLPAGPCPNVYRLVGNDPGTLAHRNTDYNPQFRTIATEFQAWTGVVHPVDQAPTHNGITIEGPAAQFGALSLCKLADNNPTLFAIDRPYFDPAFDGAHPYVIQGTGFGAAPGVLRLGSTIVPVSAANWSQHADHLHGACQPHPWPVPAVDHGNEWPGDRQRSDVPSLVADEWHEQQHVPASDRRLRSEPGERH